MQEKNIDKKYLSKEDVIVVEHSWKVTFNHTFKYKPEPFRVPRLKDAIKLFPTAIRYFISGGTKCYPHNMFHEICAH